MNRDSGLLHTRRSVTEPVDKGELNGDALIDLVSLAEQAVSEHIVGELLLQGLDAAIALGKDFQALSSRPSRAFVRDDAPEIDKRSSIKLCTSVCLMKAQHEAL